MLDIDTDGLAHDHIELCFSGLDTYADVYLNDAPILQADNMFRSWNADIKRQARAGKNVLCIVFHSLVQNSLAQAEAHLTTALDRIASIETDKVDQNLISQSLPVRVSPRKTKA